MTVSNIIAEPIKVCRLLHSENEINEKVNGLMETVGLAPRFANAYPHELDGGRRQRIGIARALAVDPKFIVMNQCLRWMFLYRHRYLICLWIFRNSITSHICL